MEYKGCQIILLNSTVLFQLKKYKAINLRLKYECGPYFFFPPRLTCAGETRLSPVRQNERRPASRIRRRRASSNWNFARVLSQIHRCNKLHVTACTRLVPTSLQNRGMTAPKRKTWRGEKQERRKEARGWADVRGRNSEGKAAVSKFYRVARARNVYLMPSF